MWIKAKTIILVHALKRPDPESHIIDRGERGSSQREQYTYLPLQILRSTQEM